MGTLQLDSHMVQQNPAAGRAQTTQWDLEREEFWLHRVPCSAVKRFLSHVTIKLQRVHFLVILDWYLLQLGVIRRCAYHVSVRVLLFCFRGLMSHCAHFKRNFNSLFQYFHDNHLSLVMRWYRLIDSADIFRVYFSFCCAGFATLGINSKYFKYSFNFVRVWILQVTVNLKTQNVKSRLANITVSRLTIYIRRSLRIQPFFLAHRRWGRFARRNLCDSATDNPYWWRKICPESGQELWLVDIVVILFYPWGGWFYLLFTSDRKKTKATKVKCKRGRERDKFTTKQSIFPVNIPNFKKASGFCWSSFAVEHKTLP